MKEIYTKPETKISQFQTADVVTTSLFGGGIEEGVGDND